MNLKIPSFIFTGPLPDYESRVIRLRTLADFNDLTRSKLADELDVSEAHVRNVLNGSADSEKLVGRLEQMFGVNQ